MHTPRGCTCEEANPALFWVSFGFHQKRSSIIQASVLERRKWIFAEFWQIWHELLAERLIDRGGWKYHNIKISRHSLTILTQLWPWAHLPSFKVIGGVWLHTVHHPLPSSFYFWPKIQFSGKWWENWVVIAWSSSLSINIIATAPSNNIFVNKSGGGIEGSPMGRHK